MGALFFIKWMKEIGSKSFKFHYQLADAADPAITFATGESVPVCFDYQKNASVAISQAPHAHLSAYLEK